MYKHLAISLVLLFLVTGAQAQSQCRIVIPSTNGYSVIVAITLANVIPSTTSCPWGYNYNLALNYSVSFVGTPPPSMSTLQGDFTCNGSQVFSFPLPKTGGSGTYTTGNNPWVSSDGFNVYTSNPSCNTANVTSMNCGQIQIFAGGPGMSNVTVPCNYMSTLPVELIDFNAIKWDESVLLTWSTASEKDNDFFEIEKTADGSYWYTIARVTGAGNSSVLKKYSFVEKYPEAGTHYYRLKQVDSDKKFSYSKIIALENKGREIITGPVYPNPAGNSVHMDVDSPEPGTLSYKIVNSLGELMETGRAHYGEGRTEIRVDVEKLSPGSFILQLFFANNSVISKKILKN